MSSTRIVLVEDMALEAKIIQRSLADVGYTNIVVVDDAAKAIAEVEKGARIVLTDIELGGGCTGIELAQKLRARPSEVYVYIIAMTGSAISKRLTEAFEAGVDDFIGKPVSAGELRSRMRAAERIVGLELELRAKVVELETALRRIDINAATRALRRARDVVTSPVVVGGGEAIDQIVQTPVWCDIETTFGKALGEFLQLPFESCDAFNDDPYATEIELAEPNKQLQLVCNVTANETLMLSLAQHLMGEADMEAGQSLVLEIANVLMGCLKTGYTDIGYAFSGGLPREVKVEGLRASFSGTPRRVRLAYRTPDGAVLGVWLRTFETSAKTMAVRDLREGMVIKEDLFNEGGMLLVRGGTRLTQTTAERLARFVPNAVVTVVGVAAEGAPKALAAAG